MVNDESYPLITVIIPTKNRGEYLWSVLKTCMIQDYPNFEVIVSDDGSSDNSLEIIKKAAERDCRIKYFSHNPGLGMRDNFEFALNQVRPGYVMALGGDDGIVAGGIQRMYDILKDTGRELLTWRMSGLTYKGHSGEWGRFMVKKGRETQIVKSEDYLNRIVDSLNYMTTDCPMFYVKGIASTELVNKVKSRSKDNRFYSCPTPDGYSGVVLAGEVEDYVYTTEPLTISGSSPKSQGLCYHKDDEFSQKENEAFFSHSKEVPMHKELASQPYSPLLTLMTADYLLTAKDLPGWPGKCKEIDFKNVIRKSFAFFSNHVYSESVTKRELCIIKEIAIQHNLLDLYNELIKTTRQLCDKRISGGSIIYKGAIHLDSEKSGINTIEDAAYVTKYLNCIYTFYSGSSIFEFLHTIIKSVKLKFNKKTKKLPIV